VLLQDNNLDSGASKQQRVNQAGGTATGNTDLGLHKGLASMQPFNKILRGLKKL
jgi:hypothetical protein